MRQHFTNWPLVEGFADRQSYRAGDIVEVRCSGRAAGFSAEVARVGQERVVVWRGEGLHGAEHPITDDAYAIGCDWPVAFSFAVDPAWPSGFYEIALQADGATGERAHSEAFFVVRPAPAAARPPSSSSPPTPTTRTTSGAGPASTAARRRSPSPARSSEATCAGRRRRSRPTTTAASPASSRRARSSTCASSATWPTTTTRVVRLLGLALVGAAVVRWAEDRASPSTTRSAPISRSTPRSWTGTGSCSASVTTSTGRGGCATGPTTSSSPAGRGPSSRATPASGRSATRTRAARWSATRASTNRTRSSAPTVPASCRPCGPCPRSAGRSACDGAQLHPRRLRPGRPGHAPGTGRLHRAPPGTCCSRGPICATATCSAGDVIVGYEVDGCAAHPGPRATGADLRRRHAGRVRSARHGPARLPLHHRGRARGSAGAVGAASAARRPAGRRRGSLRRGLPGEHREGRLQPRRDGHVHQGQGPGVQRGHHGLGLRAGPRTRSSSG